LKRALEALVQVPISLMIRNGLHALTRKLVTEVLVSSLATFLCMAIISTVTDQPIFLVRVVAGESFADRTDVHILLGHVAEVLLAIATIRLTQQVAPFIRHYGHWLWQRDRDARLLAHQNLRAVEVASVGNDIEALRL
jgi:hypothetical protein